MMHYMLLQHFYTNWPAIINIKFACLGSQRRLGSKYENIVLTCRQEPNFNLFKCVVITVAEKDPDVIMDINMFTAGRR